MVTMRTIFVLPVLILLVINLTLIAEGGRSKKNSAYRKLQKKITEQETAMEALGKKLKQLTAFVSKTCPCKPPPTKPPVVSPSSCKELFGKDSSLKSGVYKISFGLQEVPVFCQMGDFGCGAGGWTPVMKINGTKRTFHYDSSYWSNREIFGVNGGQTGFDREETKLPSYWSTPFSKICLGMRIGDQINFVVIDKQAPSLYSLIADGQHRATSLGRDTWKSLIGSDASLQLKCNKEGFNAVGRINHSKARIGIIGNQENDCTSSDSRIGFGTGGAHDDSNTCGNEATFAPDNGDRHIKTMGYILVQ